MDPYASPLRSPIVVPRTHSSIPYYKNQSVLGLLRGDLLSDEYII